MGNAEYDAASLTADEYFVVHPEIGPGTDRDELTAIMNKAIGNKDVPSRLILVNRLLDWGADASKVDGERATILHGFAQRLIDPAVEAPVLKRLLDAGADPNQWSPRYGWALGELLELPRLGETALAPVYDVWFTHPSLDFTTRHGGLSGGDCLWDVVWRFLDSPTVIERTQRYAKDHGVVLPTPQYHKRQPDKSWLRFEHGQTIQKGENGFWYVVADAPAA